jgi:hypothetical protein
VAIRAYIVRERSQRRGTQVPKKLGLKVALLHLLRAGGGESEK